MALAQMLLVVAGAAALTTSGWWTAPVDCSGSVPGPPGSVWLAWLAVLAVVAVQIGLWRTRGRHDHLMARLAVLGALLAAVLFPGWLTFALIADCGM